MKTELNFSDDAADRAPESEGGLKMVVKMAEVMVAQAQEVQRLDDELKSAKAALRRTETEDLPEIMREIGMASVILSDGSTISVVEDVECYISEDRRPAAHAWLVENDFGGLIKTHVITAFERGEIDEAVAYAQQATEAWPEHPATLKDAVHPATLKAFVKEQLKAGVAIPFDLLGVRPFNRAKYKAAKV